MPVANLIIDSDSHVTEPADVWTARVPKKYVDDVPHVERIDGADIWVLQNKRIGSVGTSAPGGMADLPPELPADLRRLPPRRLECDGPAGLHGRGGHLGPGALPQRRGFRQRELPRHGRRRAQALERAGLQRLSDGVVWGGFPAAPRRARHPVLGCGGHRARGLALRRRRGQGDSVHRRAAALRASGARKPPLGSPVGRCHSRRVCPFTSTSAMPGICRAS